MELRHLRYFVMLADELHFARAAERLHIVQSALSMQIKNLETELGAQLFERNRRRVSLTPTGEALLPEARRCLKQAEQARLAVANTVAGTAGHVRIGYSASAMYSGILRTCLARVQAQRPSIRLSVEEIHPQSQTEALIEKDLDIVLSTTLAIPHPPALARHVLQYYPVRLAIGARHPLAEQPSIAPALLADVPFIGYSGPNDAAGSMLYQRVLGYEPHIICQVDNPMTVLGLVETGIGVAIISGALISRFQGDLVYRPLEGVDVQMDISLSHRRQSTSPSVDFFIETAIETAQPDTA